MTRAEIHHVNVGQGDSTLIVTPSEETVLVDTGENPYQRRPGEDPNEIDIETTADIDRLFGSHDSFMPGEYLESLDHRSASGSPIRIDHVVLTHPHEDHQYYAPDVVEQFEVGTVHVSPVVREHPDVSGDLAVEMDEHGVRLNPVEAGDSIPVSGVDVDVIAPESNPAGLDADLSAPTGSVERVDSSSLNRYSLVLNVSHGHNDVVLPGDAPASQLRTAYDEHGVHPDVVLGSHHLARNGNLLGGDLVHPTDDLQFVVASHGTNPYGHPHDEVLTELHAQGVPTVSTRVNGCVRYRSDGRDVEVWVERRTGLDPRRLLGDSPSTDAYPKPGSPEWRGPTWKRICL
ncbi:ComEC/Rec2 family competence protein [Salinigranum marinum]|uniref:ComEC/Rec2 family competence protein n=1 Tax=Salinigranum marinum TaxID=1515595 RepID=UPI002989A3EF|nr:MBL fold metallo-hydrolase [Salinigranum marinum]